MAATATVSMKPPIATSRLRAGAAGSSGDTDAGRAFDGHLDAARQQQSHAPQHEERGAQGPAQDDATPKPAKDANASASGSTSGTASGSVSGSDTAAAAIQATEATATGKPVGTAGAAGVQSAKDGTTDQGDDDTAAAAAASQAAAMLALLGHAPPAAAAPTGGAGKVMSATLLKTVGGKLADAAQPAALDASAAGDAGAVPASPQDPSSSTPGAFAATLDVAPIKLVAQKGPHEPSVQDLASLASVAPQAALRTTPAPVHALQIASPAGTPAFAQELGQQVAWLGGQDLKQARIRLHPEELGQLDVKLSVTHNRVDVTFAVQHPAAVHAVQQTLAQLDTLLAQHGLALGHAEVGQQQSHNDGQRSGAGGASGAAAIDADGEGFAAQPQPAPTAIGLLDTFA